MQDFFVNNDKVILVSVHEKNRWPKTGSISDCSYKNLLNIPVPENLVRISVGIENVDDLIEDLQTALN